MQLSPPQFIAKAKPLVRPIDVRLALAEERERRRIARGLHDDIGQILAVVECKLREFKSTEVSAQRAQEIEGLRTLIAGAIAATRSLTFDLASPLLHELGLEPALRSLGQRMLAPDRVRFHFGAENHRQRAPAEEVGVILYRCSRELLRNVLDHAHASNVWMRLAIQEYEILLSVEDDGVGFEPSGCDAAFGPGGHYGLHSVREQLAGLGGRFEITASPGSGTRIIMSLPMYPGQLRDSSRQC